VDKGKAGQTLSTQKDFVQKQAMFLGLHWVFDENIVRPVIKTCLIPGISGVTYTEVIHHKQVGLLVIYCS
jgi:hypothetical protein